MFLKLCVSVTAAFDEKILKYRHVSRVKTRETMYDIIMYK